ncbi:MAG: lysyl oxidase family protein [Candidatus Binatia bacterium]
MPIIPRALLVSFAIALAAALALPPFATAVRKPPGGGASDPGALIDVSMESRVGVLLDEIPVNIRQRVADHYLGAPADFWRAHAKRQVETTEYRLTYRNFFYAKKGQLPLPPEELWQIEVGTPTRRAIDGHDLVVADYKFRSTILTSTDSPAASDRRLAKIGGTWDEPFVLPADPELLLQRTGYACMDEEDFPPNSVDGENAREFFDDLCRAHPADCHVTEPFPTLSCNKALERFVGRVDAVMHFERIPWNAARASAVRVGEAGPEGADLEVLANGLENHRLIYRYIEPGSCAIEEGCVGGPGWRRLLQFDASVKNIGASPVHVGDVGDESDVVQHNMFEFSACHGHMHFSHYGDFTYDVDPAPLGSKRAFCLESVTRYENNEETPLTHPYSCHYQGVAAGWGDDYIAGIDCQWIDVTNLDTAGGPVTAPLVFEVNPDGFLCEGFPRTDADGRFLFEPTGFVTEGGLPVDRIQCDFTPGWEDRNFGAKDATIPPTGSFVTEVCSRGQAGPRRDCGFAVAQQNVACTPGAQVTLRCSVADGTTPQTLRVCEASKVLGIGTACTYRDALFNRSVGERAINVRFRCPAARDASEPGGLYAVYTTPTFAADPRQGVVCEQR